MADTIMIAIAALVAAAIAVGTGRATSGGHVPGTVPGAPPVALDGPAALRAFLVIIAKEALGAFGSDKWWQVTEGRKGDTYSNCGDLVHAVLWWAGCRLPNVNRQRDGRQWKPGNIAEIRALFESRKGWTWYPAPSAFVPGDVLLIGDYSAKQLEHVAMVVSVSGDTLKTADYGQVGQGGSERTRAFVLSGGKWRAEDGRILTARGNVDALTYAAAAEAPTVLQTPAVKAATASLNASRGANA